MAKTIKDLKQAILDEGFTIEKTTTKGRYKIISKCGNFWQTVRFKMELGYPWMYRVKHYPDGTESWLPVTLEGLKELL